MTTMTQTRPVLVGLDGTEAGERALEWALREALVRDAQVQVITVWAWDGRSMEPTATLRPGRSTSRPAGRARQTQETLVARVLAAFGYPAPPVTVEIAEGDPASRLIERSGSADLLVLGGHDGEHPHHGSESITEICVRYAECPVVVVPFRPGVAAPRRSRG